MRITLLLLICCLSYTSFSQNKGLWTKLPASDRTAYRIKTTKSDLYQLDLNSLKQILENAPDEKARNSDMTFITIPLENGRLAEFKVWHTNTIAPGFQSKYPGIKNFIIRGVTDPSLYGRIDVTYQGFHALINNHGKSIYIDPAHKDNTDKYLVYDSNDAIRTSKFECLFDDSHQPQNEPPSASVSDNHFRTYRMALSCTGEYAQFHGGTVEQVLSAMNTTINRINFVYEHQFAVRFEIIANTDTLIYLDPTSDPYDNEDINMQLNQNQIECDTKIGTDNYDIGHIFSTGGGGLAGYAVTCNKDRKAWGGTGSGSPINDPFDIDYVAHEVGHQMSGSHTQNNACNRDLTASYEPGSASTIMGYAGICAPNVQDHSDAYFHGYSIKEMGQYIVNGFGDQCATKTDLPGELPIITYSSGDYTIPAKTPFELTAQATGEAPLLYRWEQLDSEIAEVQPPVETNKFGPLFRSYYADSSGIRTFPKMEYIVNNTTNTWETLPAVSRDINFILTVREDVAGGAKHSQKTNKLTVDQTKGPFLVTYPNQKYITWYIGDKVDVIWDVAQTDKGPVNCKLVQILLSEDGGYTYPYLLTTTANDGSEQITVPDIIGKNFRIKIKADDNVFFDISNNNFEIKSGLPPFSISLGTPSDQLCQGDSTEFYIYATSIDSIADTIVVAHVSDNPGFDIKFSQDSLFDGDSIKITIINTNAAIGNNSLLFHFTTKSLTVEKGIAIQTYSLPSKPSLFSPVNYSENVTPNIQFRWNKISDQTVTYNLEVSKYSDFNELVLKASGLVSNIYIPETPLDNNTIYYWRINAEGICGKSVYSNTNVLRTGVCSQFYSSISDSLLLNSGTSYDSIRVSNLTFDKIKSLEVINLKGFSESIGDLSAVLKAGGQGPSKLWNEQCSGSKNIALKFSDNFLIDEIPCDSINLLFGMYKTPIKPVQSFIKFKDLNPENTYTLEIHNNNNTNTGFLYGWGLNLCGNQSVCAPLRIPTSTKLYTSNTSCKDEDGWTHYSISADKNPVGNYELMLVSLKLNEHDTIAPEDVKVSIPTSARYTKINNAEYITDPTNWTVLNRHWLINPAIQPYYPVEMRFYLTDIEISSLLDAAQLPGLTDSLKVFSVYSNGILDPNPVNKHSGVKITDVKLHEATLGSYNLNKYLEFTIPYLADGCVGAGGSFKAVSSDKNLVAHHIRIFPNPANSMVRIDGINKSTLVRIYHITGKEVISVRIDNPSDIDISGLAGGTYIVKTLVDSSEQTFKLVIID